MEVSGGRVRPRELRLAVVCYGGVSLAVYMHGITKELHKLVRASREFDRRWPDRVADNPFRGGEAGTDSEYAYFEQLRDLAERGTPVSVVVDIVAGTSAGGINGVCLAKVLAHGGSQDRLKKLWIDEGDLKQLIKAPPIGGWRTRALLSAAHLIMRPTTSRFPLRGDHMSCLLFDALRAMEPEQPDGETRSLVPATGSLDLFVTTTDVHGFDVLVPSGAGGVSQHDTDHAQTLRFQYRPGSVDDFTVGDTGSLAFAARATSAFPGAFPPISLASFAAELASERGQRELDADRLSPRFRRPYAETGSRLQDAWFVDGGVLDNAPFDLVIDAIAHKRAETEVIRRLVYIQPDPGQRLTTQRADPAAPGGAGAGTEPPAWLPSVLGAMSSVKGSHPILRDLLDLRDLNLRIQEVGAIAEAQQEEVLAILDAPDPLAPDAAAGGRERVAWEDMGFEDVKARARLLHEAARTLVGLSHSTYCQLKLEAAGHTLADELARLLAYPPDSSHRSFLRAVLTAWAQRQPAWRTRDLDALSTLLGPADIPYRERRVMFMLSCLGELYAAADAPPVGQLDWCKAKAWDLLESVRRAPADAVDALPSDLTTCLAADTLGTAGVFASPEAFATEHDKELTALFTDYSRRLGRMVEDSSGALWQEYQAGTAGWAPQHRRSLLSRYVGFPLWDAMIFPTIALSGLPQFTPIGVTQLSPLAAGALAPPGGEKLRGVRWRHFGGFMDAAWRENDYLWGRLDGVELILRTLRSSVDPAVPEPTTAGRMGAEEAAAAAGPYLREGLTRILDAETDLRRVGDLRRSLSAQLEAPAAVPPAEPVTATPASRVGTG